MYAELRCRGTVLIASALAASIVSTSALGRADAGDHRSPQAVSRASSLEEYDPDLDLRYNEAAADPVSCAGVNRLADYLLAMVGEGLPALLARGEPVAPERASRDDCARRWSLVASLFEMIGDRARAETSLRLAAELAQTNETRRFVRAAPGEWLAVSGRIREAAELLRRVLAEDPGNAMAEVYLKALDNPLSIGSRDMAALERFMPVVVARQNVGSTLINMNEIELGLEHIEIAAALDGSDLTRNLRLGMAYLAAGRLALADFHLSNVLALAPGDPSAHWLMAGICVNLDRTEEAADRVMDAVRLGFRPTSALDYVMLTFAYAEQGYAFEAFEFLIEAARLGQEVDDSMIVTGALAASSVLSEEPNRLVEVRRLIENALWLYPDSARLRLLLAARMVEGGELQPALEEVLLAGMIEPGLVSRDLVDVMSRGADAGEAARRAGERFRLLRDGIKRSRSQRSDFQ